MEGKETIIKGSGLGKLHEKAAPEKPKERSTKEEKKERQLSIIMILLILVGIVSVGFSVAEVATLLHGVRFGFYLWPLIVCADVFALCSFGYFVADNEAEKIYGLCAMISFAAVQLQLIVLF